jgi:hypothetical protein
MRSGVQPREDDMTTDNDTRYPTELELVALRCFAISELFSELLHLGMCERLESAARVAKDECADVARRLLIINEQFDKVGKN